MYIRCLEACHRGVSTCADLRLYIEKVQAFRSSPTTGQGKYQMPAAHKPRLRHQSAMTWKKMRRDDRLIVRGGGGNEATLNRSEPSDLERIET